ncbi:unnamed protein product [Danaus chrysippus]|uniref:(African queen) hypothetical protein n=1 Tax=Danaus chrysippus TaxID=151541 RepID=A0A8J2R7W2_9NEOP|nr:unnamed protein product [Danaus chrysippus]
MSGKDVVRAPRSASPSKERVSPSAAATVSEEFCRRSGRGEEVMTRVAGSSHSKHSCTCPHRRKPGSFVAEEACLRRNKRVDKSNGAVTISWCRGSRDTLLLLSERETDRPTGRGLSRVIALLFRSVRVMHLFRESMTASLALRPVSLCPGHCAAPPLCPSLHCNVTSRAVPSNPLLLIAHDSLCRTVPS